MSMQQIFKQAQMIQKKIEDAQAKLTQMEFTGAAGGGMVKVVVNGKGEMRRTEIDPSLLTPDEKEVLEDLIVAAFTDAKRQAEAAFADQMGDVTGGALPPGLKLPF